MLADFEAIPTAFFVTFTDQIGLLLLC